jgi:hypothetical protein
MGLNSETLGCPTVQFGATEGIPHVPKLGLALLEVGGDGFHLVGGADEVTEY